MEKIFALLLGTFFLTACVMSFDTFAEAWPYLKGKNIQVAIDHLGIPDNKYSIDANDIYVWSTESSYTSFSPTTTNSSGTVGGVPFNGTATSYAPHTSNLSCVIKIKTMKKIIQTMEFDGNNGACLQYSERLRPLIEKNKK